jgi:hypothetical protein
MNAVKRVFVIFHPFRKERETDGSSHLIVCTSFVN